MHLDPPPTRGLHRERTGVDSLERPRGRAVVAEKLEVEPIAASNIENTAVPRNASTPTQEAPGIETRPHPRHRIARNVSSLVSYSKSLPTASG
jgi:hypothetical protein